MERISVNENDNIFELIDEQSILGIVLIQDYRVLYANNAWCEISGFSEAEMTQWAPGEYFKQIYLEDRENVKAEAKKKLSGELNYRVQYDWRLITKSGKIKWISMFSRPVVFKGKAAIIASMVEITESKRYLAALQESETKYRSLVENAKDAIFIAQDDKIKFPNPKAVEMTGYSAEEIAEIPFISFVHPRDRELVLDRYKRRLRGETVTDYYSFQVVNRSGRTFWVELTVVLINWEGRPASLIILRDITPQKTMEAQLLQSQKMESIGTLAGGIAHDFNNLLMGMLGRVSLMRLDMDHTHPFHDHLVRIEDHIKSANDLTKKLLGFARGGKYQSKPTDINALLENSADIFGRARKEIRILMDLAPDVWTVEVDRGQIEQVLLNLYVNAWQAMPTGGTLSLRTENREMSEDETASHAMKAGRYVKLSVTDTGVGIDEAIQPRIFDPFFTTKRIGGGTGLGLASVYGIVKNHKGFITVFSEKGQGSTFSIYLPASEKSISEKPPAEGPKTSHHVVRGTGKILLVDDERLVLEVSGKLLERLGYSVIAAGSGREALELYAREKSGIDLVILDMIMPEMSGGETFNRLREMDPNLKVLLSSGYTLSGQAKKIMAKGCIGFLQKPFNIQQLSVKLRKILSAPMTP